MIIRSRAVVTMSGPPIEDGAVVVHEGRISDAGTFQALKKLHDGPVTDLGDRVLLPGLINAHCHLEYTILRRAIDPQKNFTEWIRRINALKRSLTLEDYAGAIAAGFREMALWGTTSVLNIESFPELLPSLPPPPLRAWWFYEMIDIRHPIPTEQAVFGALSFFDGMPGWIGGFGLSPHAPYTASRQLYELAARCSGKLGIPLTTHVAESRDEELMFRQGGGPLHDFVRSLGRDMSDCGGRSAFARLVEAECVNDRSILVHMNELQDDDFELVAERLRKGPLHVVHCPRSHAYFHHTPFAFERLHNLGANISLGTDSLASCDSLNLFADLQCAWKAQPWIGPEDLLRTVTTNPAKALGMEGRLGVIAPGAMADMIALAFTGPVSSVYKDVVENREPVGWMMIDGRTKQV